jgi:hypothetical protein
MKTTKNKSKNKSKNNKTKKFIYKKYHFTSGDGMLTSVWGPSLWHYLHTMSFNYPVNPTQEEKHNYRKIILNLKNVLPCKYCRLNLKKNFKELPLTIKHMKNRETFSRYVYELHELINKMLNKKSGLSYNDVRERYEHFRARCNKGKKIIISKDHKGCTDPVNKIKSKGVVKIVPITNKCESLEIDDKCKEVV